MTMFSDNQLVDYVRLRGGIVSDLAQEIIKLRRALADIQEIADREGVSDQALMHDMVLRSMKALSQMPPCDECGDPSTHTKTGRDVCPTDRGDEVREYRRDLCDECDPKEKTCPQW